MKELQSVLNIVSDGLTTLAEGVESSAEHVNSSNPKKNCEKADTKSRKEEIRWPGNRYRQGAEGNQWL